MMSRFTGSTPRDLRERMTVSEAHQGAGSWIRTGQGDRPSERQKLLVTSAAALQEGGRAMTLIHRICIALSGFGSPRAVERVMRESADTAVESWNTRKFWMLRKMPAKYGPSAFGKHQSPEKHSYFCLGMRRKVSCVQMQITGKS